MYIYMFYQSYKAETRCVGVSIKLKNAFLSLTNISVVLHNVLQCVWIKHFTKGLHTQQRLKTN